MALEDDLKALADELAGGGWRTKFPADWTESERRAVVLELKARGIDYCDWLVELMDTPFETTVLDHWRCGPYSFKRVRTQAGAMVGTSLKIAAFPPWDGADTNDSLYNDPGPYERACTPEELEEMNRLMGADYVAEVRACSEGLAKDGSA